MLHTTVVGKAEWMDVNDLIKDHRRTVESVEDVQLKLKELKNNFQEFEQFSE